MKLSTLALVAPFALVGFGVNAETVATTDGTFTVIESVAPLLAPLKYSSGGDGLVGLADAYPVAASACGGDATGVNFYDHCWQQFNPAIVWKAPSSTSSVFAIPGVDHGPSPYENMEFIIWGSNDGSTWEEGKIAAIYRDGFDTAATTVGMSDDYTTLWSFKGSYTLFSAAGGNHLIDSVQDTEGEIDSLAMAVPEPETYALMALGLGVVGFAARRRRAA